MKIKNKNKIKKIFNRFFFILLFLIVEVGILYSAYGALDKSITQNKADIEEYQRTQEEIYKTNDTTAEISNYLDRADELTENLPLSKDLTKIVEEIEAIRAKSHVVDMDVLTEEGLDVNLQTLYIKSHTDKSYKNEFDGIGEIKFKIVVKGNYDDIVNFIELLEKTNYVNRITKIQMKKSTINIVETDQETLYEYLNGEIEIIFYYREDESAGSD